MFPSYLFYLLHSTEIRISIVPKNNNKLILLRTFVLIVNYAWKVNWNDSRNLEAIFDSFKWPFFFFFIISKQILRISSINFSSIKIIVVNVEKNIHHTRCYNIFIIFDTNMFVHILKRITRNNCEAENKFLFGS